MSYSKLCLYICTVIYAASAVYITWLGLTTPSRNFDMIAYIGSIISWGTDDVDAIYQASLAAFKLAVWPAYYEDISVTNKLTNNAEAFRQLLPFYNIRPLYLGVVYITHQTGFGLAESTWIVSALCFAALSITLYFVPLLHWWKSLWLLALVGLCWIGGYTPMKDLARLSTPDCMAVLFMSLCILAALKRWHTGWFAVFAMLAVLSRTDSAITVTACCILFWYMRYLHLPYAIGISLISLAMTFGIHHYAGYYGWEVLFHYSLIDRTPYPETIEASLTWDQYIRTMEYTFPKQLLHTRLIPAALLSAFAMGICVTVGKYAKLGGLLLIVMWGNYVARFLLHPMWGDERYYYVNYIWILFACILCMQSIKSINNNGVEKTQS